MQTYEQRIQAAEARNAELAQLLEKSRASNDSHARIMELQVLRTDSTAGSMTAFLIGCLGDTALLQRWHAHSRLLGVVSRWSPLFACLTPVKICDLQ